MDKTETYIKMCGKAEEIQCESFRHLMPDDMVAYRIAHSVTTIWRHETSGLTTIPYSQTFIWLPRQDQLQEMVHDFEPDILTLLNNFTEWCILDRQIWYKESTTSMEQLWLAFVMKKKYNKVWNGNEWAVKLGDDEVAWLNMTYNKD